MPAALDLGDVRFGFSADLEGIKRAHQALRQWARDVDSIVAKTDSLGASLQKAAARQEQSIRKAAEQTANLNAQLERTGAPSRLFQQSSLALEKLRSNMKAGQLNALDFARANDKYATSIGNIKRQLAEYVAEQKAREANDEAAANAASRLRRQVEALQIATGGEAAAEVKRARALETINAAVKQGVVTQEQATKIQKAYSESLITGSKEAGVNVDRLRRQLESLQLSIGGTEANTVKLSRAETVLNSAYKEGLITQERMISLTNAYAASLKNNADKVSGFTRALLAMREELAGLRKVAFTLNSLVASIFFVSMGFKATVGAAAEFEDAMTKVYNLTGQSIHQVNQWRDAILKMAPAVGQSPKQLADSFQFIGSAGLKTAQVLGTVRDVAKGAAIGLGDTASLGRLVVSVMNTFPKSMTSASQVLGVLIGAIRKGTAEGPEFAAAMGQVLSVGRTLGVSFNELAAAIAVFTDQGLSAQESATLLVNLLRALLNPSAQAAKAFSNMYVNGQQLSAGMLQNVLRTQGLEAALKLLSKAAQGNSQDLARILGSSRAVRAAFGLLINGGKQMTDVFNSVRQASSNLFQQAWATESQTPAFKMKQALTSIQTALTQISQSALPLVAKIAQSIASNIQVIIHWIEVLGGILLSYFVGRVLGALSAAGTKAMGAISAFSAKFMAATREATLAAKAWAGTTTLVKGAVGALGGPLGILAIGAAAIFAFKDAQDQAGKSAQQWAQNLDIARESLKSMDKAQLQLALDQARLKIHQLAQQEQVIGSTLPSPTWGQRIKQAIAIPLKYVTFGAVDVYPKGTTLQNQEQIVHLKEIQSQLKSAGNYAQELVKRLNDINGVPYDYNLFEFLGQFEKSVAGSSGNNLFTFLGKFEKSVADGLKGFGPSAATIRGAVTAMQQYIQKVGIESAAVQQSNYAKAKAKATQEALTIAQKATNNNVQQTQAVMQALRPYIVEATKAWRDYYDAMDAKKNERKVQSGLNAVQQQINKLKDIQVVTARSRYVQQQMSEAVQKLYWKGPMEAFASPVADPNQVAAASEALAEYNKMLYKVQEASKAAFDARQLQGFIQQAGRKMQSAFVQFFYSPFKDGLRGMVTSFADAIRQMTAQWLAFMAIKAISKATSGDTGFLGFVHALASAYASGSGYAKGAAFHMGSVTKYAAGGVVNSPTYFPMAGGSTGLMGEASPEAIMPLMRGPGGYLGVRAAGGGGRSTNINMINNINASGAGPTEVSRIWEFGQYIREQVRADVDHKDAYGYWPGM